MCFGGGGQKAVQPIPSPPTPVPAAPPREPVAARKPVEAPDAAPDVQLGSKKNRTNRSSIKTSSVGVTATPNTGTKAGSLNI